MIDKKLFFEHGPHGRLACLTFNWNKDNKARILMAHGYDSSGGMAEHAKLFYQFAEDASKHGYGVWTFDFTGNGASDGYFHDMSPNRRIAEVGYLLKTIREDYYGPLYLLGLSMGGAVSIHAAHSHEKLLSGLITWSSVPSFDTSAPSASWYPSATDLQKTEFPGEAFYKDRPVMSVAGAYCGLSLPKIQIQGDQDLPFFQSEFAGFFASAKEPKIHHIIPGADHVFTQKHHRDEAVRTSLEWIESQLGTRA